MHRFFNVSKKFLRGTLYEWRRCYILTSSHPFTLFWLPSRNGEIYLCVTSPYKFKSSILHLERDWNHWIGPIVYIVIIQQTWTCFEVSSNVKHEKNFLVISRSHFYNWKGLGFTGITTLDSLETSKYSKYCWRYLKFILDISIQNQDSLYLNRFFFDISH